MIYEFYGEDGGQVWCRFDKAGKMVGGRFESDDALLELSDNNGGVVISYRFDYDTDVWNIGMQLLAKGMEVPDWAFQPDIIPYCNDCSSVCLVLSNVPDGVIPVWLR